MAVKPFTVETVLKELQATNALTPEHLVVSIAAGVTIANMEVRGDSRRAGWGGGGRCYVVAGHCLYAGEWGRVKVSGSGREEKR